MKKKLKSRKILKKPKKLLVVIKESKPVKETSKFMREEFEETKRSLFFN